MPIAAELYYFLHKPQAGAVKRPPVILLHGSGGNHLSWPPQVRRMADERIYALDLPGHGKSEGMGEHSINEYMDYVITFMKVLKIGAAVIVGVSMGSAIALNIALKYPRKVLGLGLIGAGAKMRVSPAILDTVGNETSFESAVDLIHENCFSENVPPSLIQLSKRYMLEMRPPVLLGDFLACNEFNVMEQLPRIKTPTLLICGAEDKMTPVKYSEFLREGIPGAELQIVENAGHLVMLERPDLVADMLKQFVDKIPLRVRKPRKKKDEAVEKTPAIVSENLETTIST